MNSAITLALILPVMGGLLIVLSCRWPNVREAVTLTTAAALFAAVASLYPEVAAGGRPSLTVFEILPGLPLAFEVEPLGLLFALVASSLWFVTSVYAIGYVRKNQEKNQTRFFAFFALALAATIGIAFAANMFTLFLFYEALTLATYPLVTHAGTPAAKQGGRVYLGILLSTSIAFQLVAIIWTWSLTGTLDFTDGGILGGQASDGVLIALLALYMFGIGKAALMPFHYWLPAAMVAPTPVSALLHAVAVVKAGVFTVLKVIVYIFGLETLSASNLAEWLQWVAAFTLITASVVALTKTNLKARLAYSTVSQLSYIVLGAALANAWAVTGAGMHIAMHAFGKITLFFCAGALYVAAKKTEIPDLDGIGRRMPVTMLAFFVGAVAVIGLPPTGGSWSKWYLMLGAVDSGQLALVGVLAVSTLLNIAYLMPIVARAFLFPPTDGYTGGVKEAPLMVVVPLCVTAAATVALFFFARPIADLMGMLS
ncbi:MAG: proton-conducting transporter membrane subunit [Gammaproteobacteria bacterium]